MTTSFGWSLAPKSRRAGSITLSAASLLPQSSEENSSNGAASEELSSEVMAAARREVVNALVFALGAPQNPAAIAKDAAPLHVNGSSDADDDLSSDAACSLAVGLVRSMLGPAEDGLGDEASSSSSASFVEARDVAVHPLIFEVEVSEAVSAVTCERVLIGTSSHRSPRCDVEDGDDVVCINGGPSTSTSALPTSTSRGAYMLLVPMVAVEALAAARLSDVGKAFSMGKSSSSEEAGSSSGTEGAYGPSSGLTRYGRLRAHLAGDVVGTLLAAVTAADADTDAAVPPPLGGESAAAPKRVPLVALAGFVALCQSIFLATSTASLAKMRMPSAAVRGGARGRGAMPKMSDHDQSYDALALYEAVRVFATDLATMGAFMFPPEAAARLLAMRSPQGDDEQPPAVEALLLPTASSVADRLRPSSLWENIPMRPIPSDAVAKGEEKGGSSFGKKGEAKGNTLEGYPQSVGAAGDSAHDGTIAKEEPPSEEAAVAERRPAVTGRKILSLKSRIAAAQPAAAAVPSSSPSEPAVAALSVAVGGGESASFSASLSDPSIGGLAVHAQPTSAGADGHSPSPSYSLVAPLSLEALRHFISAMVAATLEKMLRYGDHCRPPKHDNLFTAKGAAAIGDDPFAAGVRVAAAVHRSLTRIVGGAVSLISAGAAAKPIISPSSRTPSFAVAGGGGPQVPTSSSLEMCWSRILFTVCARRFATNVLIDTAPTEPPVCAASVSLAEKAGVPFADLFGGLVVGSSAHHNSAGRDSHWGGSHKQPKKRKQQRIVAVMGGVCDGGDSASAPHQQPLPLAPICTEVCLKARPAPTGSGHGEATDNAAGDGSASAAELEYRAYNSYMARLEAEATRDVVREGMPRRGRGRHGRRRAPQAQSKSGKRAPHSSASKRPRGGGEGDGNSGDETSELSVDEDGELVITKARRRRNTTNKGGDSASDTANSGGGGDESGYDSAEEAFIARNAARIEARVRTLMGTRERRMVDVRVVFIGPSDPSAAAVRNTNGGPFTHRIDAVDPSSGEVDGKTDAVASVDDCDSLPPIDGVSHGPFGPKECPRASLFAHRPRHRCIVFRHVAYKKRGVAQQRSASSAVSPSPPPLEAHDACYVVGTFDVTPRHLHPMRRWVQVRGGGGGGGASGAMPTVSGGAAYDYHELRGVSAADWLGEGGYLPPAAASAVAGDVLLRRCQQQHIQGASSPKHASPTSGDGGATALYEYSAALSVEPLLMVPSAPHKEEEGGNKSGGDTKLSKHNSSPFVALDGPGEAVTAEVFYALLVPAEAEVTDVELSGLALSGDMGNSNSNSNATCTPLPAVLFDPASIAHSLPPVPPLPAPSAPPATVAGLGPHLDLPLGYCVRFAVEGARRGGGSSSSSSPSSSSQVIVRVFEVDPTLAYKTSVDDTSPFANRGSVASAGRRHADSGKVAVASPSSLLPPPMGSVVSIAMLQRVCGALRRLLVSAAVPWSGPSRPSAAFSSPHMPRHELLLPLRDRRGARGEAAAVLMRDASTADDSGARLLQSLATTLQRIDNAATRAAIAASGSSGGADVAGVPALPPPLAVRLRSVYERAHAASATGNDAMCVGARKARRVEGGHCDDADGAYAEEDTEQSADAEGAKGGSEASADLSLELDGAIYSYLFGPPTHHHCHREGGGRGDGDTALALANGLVNGAHGQQRRDRFLRAAMVAFVDSLSFAIVCGELPPCVAARVVIAPTPASREEGPPTVAVANPSEASPTARRAVLKLGSRFINLRTAVAEERVAEDGGANGKRVVLPPPPTVTTLNSSQAATLFAVLDGARRALLAPAVSVTSGGSSLEGVGVALSAALRQVTALGAQMRFATHGGGQRGGDATLAAGDAVACWACRSFG